MVTHTHTHTHTHKMTTILNPHTCVPRVNYVNMGSGNKGWSLLYLPYWHPQPAVLILFTSVYYEKWAFTFVNYKLVKKSTTISGLGQVTKVDFCGKSSDQGSFLAGIKQSRPKIGPIKFWSRLRVSVQCTYEWPPLVAMRLNIEHEFNTLVYP